jgi:hypothetical protein
MEKQRAKTGVSPVLQVGKNYFVGGKRVSVVIADGTGCNRCVFEPQCARFCVKSNLLDYHLLCGAYYRGDCQSVVFVNYKESE